MSVVSRPIIPVPEFTLEFVRDVDALVSSIRKVRRAVLVKHRTSGFSLELMEGKRVPGIVMLYWKRLDDAFNTQYADKMMKLVDLAMRNRDLMSAPVQEICDKRRLVDSAWVPEWEDCHEMAFFLARNGHVPVSLIRTVKQNQNKRRGLSRKKEKPAMEKSKDGTFYFKAKEKKDTKKCADGVEVLDL